MKMRGNKYALIILLALLVIPVGFVAAANSQGLTWGAAVGDEFRFNYAIDSNMEYVTPYDEVVVVEIIDLPDLPEIFTHGFMYLDTTISAEYANGTEIPHFDRDIYFGDFILPVGNWTVFSEIYQGAFEYAEEYGDFESFSGSVIDSISIWGYEISFVESFEYPELVNQSTQLTYHHSKSDGVIDYVMVRHGRETSDDYYQRSITREGYLGGILGFDPMIGIIVAFGVIALIFVIVIIIKR